jgi:DNA-binding response OmpR family regulator
MKPHLLVVDDDLELQELLRIILERHFEVSQAVNGEQAVSLALHSTPDLVLLDVMLPDIDGFEVCRRLKSDNLTRSVPVMLVTARADILSLVEAQNLTVDDVLKKPFAPRELLQRVNKILQRPEVSQGTGRLQPIATVA